MKDFLEFKDSFEREMGLDIISAISTDVHSTGKKVYKKPKVDKQSLPINDENKKNEAENNQDEVKKERITSAFKNDGTAKEAPPGPGAYELKY
jgi:hypothetical protein